MPDLSFPQIDVNKAAADVNNALKDGAYVAVGLGVLGFQRAQVRRVELTKQLESQLAGLGDLPTTISKQVESYRKQAITQAEQLAEQFNQQFGSAGKLLEGQAEVIRLQLAELAKTLDERIQPVRRQFDQQVDRFEERLPEGAKTVVQTVRAAATAPEQIFRTVAGL
jgi:hypothetical protein